MKGDQVQGSRDQWVAQPEGLRRVFRRRNLVDARAMIRFAKRGPGPKSLEPETSARRASDG